ncbi:PREDICTED: uncharacterized protein LOC109342329 [Lupinus angustifolius]|uniref:uncharacterized protein LOC109342329 n=1 Tax=Lupinus angustifolius TaxID=3871 RepID=UPI00092E2C27|nr:PREDICTED: uncharacterized protein LOC109342329 [Lupinus angustifolius]
MKVFYWNCRGLGNSNTKLVLKKLCFINKPDIVFISEPMIQSSKINSSFWANLNLKLFLVNNRDPMLPNIWGICRLDINPVVIASSIQQISISVVFENQQVFISAIYAHTNYLRRRDLWAELLALMSSSSGSWCCIGDFNVVLEANECRGNHLPNRVACDDFRSFTDDGILTHIPTRGAEFTWSNRRRGHAHTEKRLDRAICNDSWLSSWSHTSCCSMPRLSSDHHPIMICFDNVSFSKLVFGNIHVRVKSALAKVEEVHNNINALGQDPDMLEQEDLAQKDLHDALNIEEEFWKEKARINWHSKGDRNTSYFHKIARIRHATKAMTLLRNGDQLLLDQSDIASHVLQYFTDLYASQNSTMPNALIHFVIPNLVCREDNVMLTKIPLHEEIKAAVFALKEEGAPGSDGFGVSQFFLQNWLLPDLNSNLVVLIPKFPGADKIEDFRPIALANFQFKIITKVLADRLASVAPKIISSQQRGFLKNRHIHDCICLASEGINLLDHKVFGGNLALKLDIKKVFDTIDWQFLMDTLRAFGFNITFINWIFIILNSAKLSISVNGQSVGFFSCKRGVGQGDPLSPLLFCLAEDVLSRGLAKLLHERKISSISGPRGIQITSHVLYADHI